MTDKIHVNFHRRGAGVDAVKMRERVTGYLVALRLQSYDFPAGDEVCPLVPPTGRVALRRIAKMWPSSNVNETIGCRTRLGAGRRACHRTKRQRSFAFSDLPRW
jgi:hypothetical protein